MIYFLHGDDIKKSRGKLKFLLDSLFSKKPNAGFFKLDIDNFSEAKLDEFIRSQGLFEQKYIVQLDFLFEDKEISKLLIAKLEVLQKSENIFICIEKKISKTILKKIEKYSVKIQEFSIKNNKGMVFGTENGDLAYRQAGFNIFDLATCFGNRNKKDLWVLYQKTKAKNIPPEEVSGIIFWQLKVMFQVLDAQNANQANLKPFVFNKAKGYLKKYSRRELGKISSNLVSIYHDSRREGLEFDLALEKFILEL